MIAATNWTWGEVDELTWPQLNTLLEYWNEYPPIRTLLHGIASGLAGRRVGVEPKARVEMQTPAVERQIRSKDDIPELMGIMRAAGLDFGVL